MYHLSDQSWQLALSFSASTASFITTNNSLKLNYWTVPYMFLGSFLFNWWNIIRPRLVCLYIEVNLLSLGIRHGWQSTVQRNLGSIWPSFWEWQKQQVYRVSTLWIQGAMSRNSCVGRERGIMFDMKKRAYIIRWRHIGIFNVMIMCSKDNTNPMIQCTLFRIPIYLQYFDNIF